jgi:hypothetical protein
LGTLGFFVPSDHSSQSGNSEKKDDQRYGENNDGKKAESYNANN